MTVLVTCGNEEELRYEVFENEEGKAEYERLVNELKNTPDIAIMNDCDPEDLQNEDVVCYMTDNGRHFLLRFAFSDNDPLMILKNREAAFLRDHETAYIFVTIGVGFSKDCTDIDVFEDKKSLDSYLKGYTEQMKLYENDADYVRDYDDDRWIIYKYTQIFSAIGRRDKLSII